MSIARPPFFLGLLQYGHHLSSVAALFTSGANVKLIYDSRIFRPILYALGKLVLSLGRWRVVGEVPDVKKFIAIAAPHTSNWDFPVFMSLVGVWSLRVRFIGKHTLFKPPHGWFFYWMGGMPVDRDSNKASDIVEVAAELFEKSDELILGLAPEGTRSHVTRWKTGFYRIALKAGVPIALIYIDSRTREIGFGKLFYPTGDQKADIEAIQAFYAGKQGIKKIATKAEEAKSA